MRFTINRLKYRRYEVGRYTYGMPKVLRRGEGAKLRIGSFCSISEHVTVILGGNHRTDWVTTYPFSVFFKGFCYIKGHPQTKGDVVIGNDVWIGWGATILSGVTVGHGAVIGAEAVVAKSVEPYAVVVGNPARLIRKRFDAETIKELLEIKWWEWDIEKIKRYIPLMLNDDIAEFIKAARQEKCLGGS